MLYEVITIRDIIGFQEKYINKQVDELDKIAAAESKEVETRKGTEKAGVDNIPYFSKVFNVINQLLFSLNASDVADHAINRLKEGKKPIIAFARITSYNVCYTKLLRAADIEANNAKRLLFRQELHFQSCKGFLIPCPKH